MESAWTTKTSLYTGSPTLKPMTTETGYNPMRHEYTPTPTSGGCHCHGGGSSASSGMEHGGCGMAMTFQSSYDGVPILIDGAVARSSGEFAGAIFAIFFLTILFRGLLYLRSYLEKTRWTPAPARVMTRLQEDDSDVELRNIDGEEPLKEHQIRPSHRRRLRAQPWNWERECGRFALTVVTSALGYAVMLITMTFVVVSCPRWLHGSYHDVDLFRGTFLRLLRALLSRSCF
jgi:hypothetical protein